MRSEVARLEGELAEPDVGDGRQCRRPGFE